MAWFDRLRQGLGKTRDLLTTDVRDLGRAWEMEWDDLEFALIGADTGAKIAAEVVAEAKRERERGTSFRESLEKALLDQLEPNRMRQKLRRVGFNLDVSRNLVEVKGKVVMVVGVNGVGKTTTIAKLGQYYTERGQRVMFAAGDTFRAAATFPTRRLRCRRPTPRPPCRAARPRRARAASNPRRTLGRVVRREPGRPGRPPRASPVPP